LVRNCSVIVHPYIAQQLGATRRRDFMVAAKRFWRTRLTAEADSLWREDRRARFRALHDRDALFTMPNPWDVGSARLLASLGFEALATTSAGFAWSVGKLDYNVGREELVAHVARVAEATPLPLSVDGERGYPDDPGGVAETVALLAEAGAAGFSIEDYDASTGLIEDVDTAAQRLAAAAAAAHRLPSPMVVTGRADNHIRGIDDLDDTISRLIAYRDAGADVLYAPGLSTRGQIAEVVDAVGAPLNVLALPNGPTIAELADLGVRRVSTGSALLRSAYGAFLKVATELLADGGSTHPMPRQLSELVQTAFSARETD
jgi:2-methylisocitrate lyase-like PEP mutase family enzyme